MIAARAHAPTPDMLYQVSALRDVDGFLSSARQMSEQIYYHLGEDVLQTGARVLDFGCGVGKALIGLHELRPDLELYGVDISENLISWCRDNLPFAHTQVTSLKPPLPFPDRYFDAINAVSVFSHLSLRPAHEWARELYRVLKPGGRIHLTTHGEDFFVLFMDVRHANPLASIAMDTVHPTGHLMELRQPTAHEGEGQLSVAVAHSREVMAQIFSGLDLKALFFACPIGNGHDAYVFQRRSSVPLLHGPWEVTEVLGGPGITLTFNVSGQKSFDILAALGTAGAHDFAPNIHVEITLNGNLLHADTRSLHGLPRTFGDRHHYPLSLSVPGDGLLTVHLRTSVPARSSLAEMHWRAVLLR